MKTLKKIIKFSQLLFLILMLSLCSKDSSLDSVNKDATSINAYFSSLPDWQTPEVTPRDDIYKDSIKVEGNTPDSSYECSIFERHLVEVIKNFISVGTNFGTIWPGAIIQGKTIKTGELKLLSVTGKRAPITLTTDIPLTETSKTIIPNSVNAQQAIADFMIAAGEMPEGSKAGAGLMNFQVEEATTFKQSMLQMGISAGFTDPESGVGLDGSLSVSSNRKSNTHTVVAKFVQEMFTVRVADDLIPKPVDFFSTDFSQADLDALESEGEIGNDNIPVYVESVTYGRILIFSLKSESVESSSELSAALEASMADYANVGGNLSGSNDKIFSTATHKVYSAGGTDAAANAAIASLDWSKFFVESPASTAVPISFVAKTLSGKEIVGVIDSTIFDRRDDCSLIEYLEPPAPEVASYDVTVAWTHTDNTGLCFGSGSYGLCSPTAFVKLEQEYTFSTLTALNGYKRSFTINLDDATPYYKFTVRSLSYLKLPLGQYTTKTQSNTYDVRNLPDGNSSIHHKMSNYAGSVTLTYVITKKTNKKP